MAMANSSSSNDQFPAKLPVFVGKNYDRRIMQMKVIFLYQDVLEMVCEGIATTRATAAEAQHATL